MNKKNIYIKIILSAFTLVACESHEQKADEAFKNFKIIKEEPIIAIDSTIIYKDSANQLLKTLPSKKTMKLDECLKYKTDLEAKVKANELAIAKLKEDHKSNTKAYRKIVHLEDINKLFLQQLKDYEQTVKNDRKAFEKKISKELNDVNLSIKEYTDTK
jgi:hypothetical protein